MPDHKKWTLSKVLFASFAFVFVLFIYGSIPFLMVPGTGIITWAIGFSHSLANDSILSIYAHDVGIPQQAAIAYGLAGVWPASLLIRMGLSPIDAYSGMALLWLGVAMFSAYQIARRFRATRMNALLGGVAWLSMPVIWAHAGYSMLSLGFALLSFYFLAAFRLLLIGSNESRMTLSVIIYAISAIIAAFMDGYTFMMFATGSSILLFYQMSTQPDLRAQLLKIAIPVHIVSFASAYLLYSAYIGKSGFDPSPIDFFRGWGLDLSYIVIPSKGVLWLPDMLGLSIKRTDELNFGDDSVWVTTFSVHVLILGLIAWWHIRKNTKISTGILLVALLGFYMALGPSLKINATKPEYLKLSHPRQQSALMSKEFELIPTGNAWISEKLPGFNVMRASYRWSALGIFALWVLIMIRLSQADKKGRLAWVLALMTVVLINLPDLQKRLHRGIEDRNMFQKIDQDIVSEFHHYVHSGETVAFIPPGNDFLANYLAPSAGFRTFNIGGDKNEAYAQKFWPQEMIKLGGNLGMEKTQIVVKMLLDGTADVVVLPYFHLLWSAHQWPCNMNAIIPGYLCPAKRKSELKPFLLAMRGISCVEIVDTDLFATIRLRSQFSGSKGRALLKHKIFENIRYPISVGIGFRELPYLLTGGWHETEADHVWSKSVAQLTLPLPVGFDATHCNAVLKLIVFGASKQRPVSILFHSVDTTWQWSKNVEATSGDIIEVKVPFAGAIGSRSVSISIPNATSPLSLTGSPDSRILGVALLRIEMDAGTATK